MPLSSGARLGHYEIVAAIGAGGMGEVYKARDTRLDRSVAIKILPPAFSADPERRARFEREAKTIAGLTHPHICTLHDVGEHHGSTFLVMEHLTGETLAQRLQKGPLPLEQALTIATEIADALSAAHRQGVVHRDLKPGNVMLTKAGAKLLDFGLAKLKGHGEQPAAAHLMSAPTQSTPLTGEGQIVGTLQYMTPEQLEGKPADARSDLWALGAILYEMVTGRRAFEGTSAASLIGNIMNAEPPALATLQPLTPPVVDWLVRQCLAKLPEDRPDTAHDVANQLRWLRETSRSTATRVQRARSRPLRAALVVAGLVVAALFGATVMWLMRPAPSPRSVARLALDISPAEDLNSGGLLPSLLPTPGGSRTALAWTPDGQALVFVGRRAGVQNLYVRRLDAAAARLLAGTEGAQAPSVSADGQWVAFFANGAIRKVPIGGGPAMDLASGFDPPKGLAWGDGGRLFFGGSDGRIWTIPAEGAPAAVTTVGGGEVAHTQPWPLPGERQILYTVRKRLWSWGDEEVVAQNLATGARKVLLKDAADARYLPSGHLVFLRRGQLFAGGFDAVPLELRGMPVAVLDGVAQALTAGSADDATGAGQVAIATTGVLAWVPGPVVPYPDRSLVAVDRQGHVSPLSAPVRSYGPVARVSPDGRRLALTIQTLAEAGVWVYDMNRGTLTRLAGGGEAMFPMWWPDGQRLVFDWLTNGRRALFTQPADATTPPSDMSAGDVAPSSFTPDGRHVAAVRRRGILSREIVVVTAESGVAPLESPTQTPQQSSAYPVFSPDGRWLAYASDVSGRFEVYVRPYPGPGRAELVSLEGGWCPAWNPNGRELFFLSLRDAADRMRMMAIEFVPGSPPRIGRPRVLFDFAERELPLRGFPVRRYDVAPDGQRFYAIVNRTPWLPPPVTHINLILNWFDELKAKVPAR